MVALLSRHDIDVMILKGDRKPYFLVPYEALTDLTPGDGEFSCCSLNHELGVWATVWQLCQVVAWHRRWRNGLGSGRLYGNFAR